MASLWKGRKIRAPADEEPGVETYSALWGQKKAASIWVLAAATTAVFAWQAARQIHFEQVVVWLLLMLLIACGASDSIHQTTRERRRQSIEVASGVWTLLMSQPRRLAGAVESTARIVTYVIFPQHLTDPRTPRPESGVGGRLARLTHSAPRGCQYQSGVLFCQRPSGQVCQMKDETSWCVLGLMRRWLLSLRV